MEIVRSFRKIYRNFIEDNKRPEIILFGNVLLDTTVRIESLEILDRFGLEKDSQGEITSERLQDIYKCLKNNTTHESVPGGSALNTSKILAVLLPKKTLFFGSIGQDETGDFIKEYFHQRNICARFQVNKTASTGQCIALIYKDERSLYANIGASKMLNTNFLYSCEEDLQFIAPEKSANKQIYYIEGFFVPKRRSFCEYVVEKYVKENKNWLACNLSAPYIVKENPNDMKYLISEANLIFGNRKEFNALAEILGESCEILMSESSELFNDLTGNKKAKVFIITDGYNGIEVSSNMNMLTKNLNDKKFYSKCFTVKRVPLDEIGDTLGAGDSFVAGFLNAFLKNLSLDECITEANEIARLVVKERGCNLVQNKD